MAHVVRHLAGWSASALLWLATAHSAHALGPDRPFAPPNARLPNTANSDAPPAPAGHLGGLRLGSTPAALIDGRWVPIGGTARGARLKDIQPPYALLQHPNGRLERLALDGTRDGAPTPAHVDKTLLP